VAVPGRTLRRKTGTRLFRGRDQLLRHLIAFLRRGNRIARLDVIVTDGARHYRRDHLTPDGTVTWRAAGKPGRPAAPKRRGETDDERRRRLARERQARHRARARARAITEEDTP
jgi:hypothetical protein